MTSQGTAEIEGMEAEVECYAGSNTSDDVNELTIHSLKIVDKEQACRWFLEAIEAPDAGEVIFNTARWLYENQYGADVPFTGLAGEAQKEWCINAARLFAMLGLGWLVKEVTK